MYERMLNKKIVPTEDNIKEFIGESAVKNRLVREPRWFPLKSCIFSG